MNLDEFDQRVEAWRECVAVLLYRAESEPESQQELLKLTCLELQTGLAELARAGAKLRQQNEALLNAHRLVEAERQRYQELFKSASDSYLITELKQSALQESEQRYRLLFESNPHPMWVYELRV